jgi:hypothetical protein
MLLASLPRRGAPADDERTGRAPLRHTTLRPRERPDTGSPHALRANGRARRVYAKAGYAPDGSTRVEPEYEAAEVPLLKGPP